MASQDKTTATTSTSEFRSVEGGAEKTTDVSFFFGLAYGAFWLLIFAFLAAGWRRQKGLAERLGRIEKSLAAADSGQK